ncbi:hypothetical protein GCM10017667_36900 [Streptomyces filamentosus]|uniref:Uncharacterized protein n=2 Tax=Streptomyces filamentosus TaxID=67294 RepID=A0A919ENK2_STRFL|nr:hypothetical protein GCM10017667_36900 [Streptomyces filamentosus]
MATASDSHPAVHETLQLVRRQLREQADAVQALSTQLDYAKSRLALLETLNTALDQFQPGQVEAASAASAVHAVTAQLLGKGGIPSQPGPRPVLPEAPVPEAPAFEASAAEAAASGASAPERGAAGGVDLAGFRAIKPFSIQEMILNVLSTAEDSLRTRDLVTIIERLRTEGHTDLLRDSRRPDSVVSSALDRLCKKGLVRKVGRGRYTLG